MIKIIIVDKQRSIRNILKERLDFEGFSVEAVEQLQQAYALYETFPFEIVIGDQQMFTEYLEREERFPNQISMIVTHDTPLIDDNQEAMRWGALYFISKPIDMNSLMETLKHIYKEKTDPDYNSEEPLPTPTQTRTRTRSYALKTEEIIGTSIEINHVRNLIDKAAPSDARVLITGPNGSGKELVARWIHEKSSRCNAPFVEVNCAAIPSELIESELFGHEKGAFTSAIKQRKGKFEQADKGTLFLDEIGDMSLSAQAKVLRVLQENRLSRVGSDKDLMVDVRIVAATNKDLREEMLQGTFREDLYHRLSVIVIPVPPLIDRLEDIPILVDHFVEIISAEHNVPIKHIDKEAMESLKKLDWSGNIRELRNVIERLIILGENESITSADVKEYALSY